MRSLLSIFEALKSFLNTATAIPHSVVFLWIANIKHSTHLLLLHYANLDAIMLVFVIIECTLNYSLFDLFDSQKYNSLIILTLSPQQFLHAAYASILGRAKYEPFLDWASAIFPWLRGTRRCSHWNYLALFRIIDNNIVLSFAWLFSWEILAKIYRWWERPREIL